MAQTAEFDLKQSVLMNDAFGPREVRQMQEVIAHDFSQYAVLRDAVAEVQAREEQTPASQVRLGVCLYLLGRYYRAIEVLSQADGGAMAHLLPGQVPLRPARVPRSRELLRLRRESRLRRERVCLGTGRSAPLRRGSGRRPENAGRPVGRRRADRRIPRTARGHGGRAGRKPQRSRGAVRTGRRGRPQPSRRPVRTGPGKRPPRQRRHGDGAVQPRRQPLSRPRRLADEPRPALRRSRAVRPGRTVLPAGAGRLSRPFAGEALFQGHRGLARTVLRRGRAEETRPDRARC